MKVFFGVVFCVFCVIYNIHQLTAISTDRPQTNSTTETPPLQENCTQLSHPNYTDISTGKTYVNITWQIQKSDVDCLVSLIINCEALMNENDENWPWVIQNASVSVNVSEENEFTIIDGLSEFTNYTCNATLNTATAISEITIISFSTNEEVPSSPVNLIVNDITATSFFIEWSEPTKIPGVLVGYDIEILINGSNHVVPENCSNINNSYIVNATNDLFYNFIGASPDFNYEITVFARTRVGRGVGIPTIITTMTSELTPPINANILTGKTEVNISWQIQKSDFDCIIVSLNIDCVALKNENDEYWPWVIQNASVSVNVSNEDVFTKIDNLSEFTNYTCNATLSTSNTVSKSTTIDFSTKEEVPSSPVNLTVKNITATSFSIKWTEPLKIPGILVGYEIEILNNGPNYLIPEYCSNNNNTWRNTTSDASYNFNEASPDFNYEIIVYAKTRVGIGDGIKENTTTMTAVPERPTNLNVNKTELTAYISWFMPCNVNGPIEGFNIILNGSYIANNSVSIFNSTHISTKEGIYYYDDTLSLRESFYYEVTVWVVLKDGTVGKNETKNFTTRDGIPGPPTVIGGHIDNKILIINWDPPTTQTGIILEYYILIKSIGPLYEIPQNCTPKNDIHTTNISGSNTVYMFMDEYPYYNNYSVQINASTTRGIGEANTPIFIETEQAVPGNVRNIISSVSNVTSAIYNAVATVLFLPPCNLNGPLKMYELMVAGTRTNLEDDVRRFNSTIPKFEFSLKPEYVYKYEITTSNEMYSSITYPSPFDNIVAPAGVPVFENTLFEDININSETYSAKVTLQRDFFSWRNGEIRYIALIISDKNITEPNFERWDGKTWPEVNYSESFYQVTNNYWNPFSEADNVTVNIGGDETNCTDNEFCRKPLENNKEYYLIIRIFTENFYTNSPSIRFRTADTSKLELILGLIFGLLGFAVLGLIAFLIWKRKLMMKLSPLFESRKLSAKISVRASTAVHLDKFIQHVKYLENNPEKLKEQYLLLAEKTKEAVMMHTTVFAELTENKRKNRYVNILPYDETRVKLLIDEDDEIGSDYINASYIKGYSGKIEYIATQGPLPSTCRDFWKMVIQENVSVIVMVSEFIEKNKEKCHRYFPKNHETMGVGEDMEVRCSMELHFGTYCVRTLQIKKDNTQAAVTHMQFLDWPDFGVPTGTDNMLQFCYQLRERLKMEGGYVLVHCSAGVGRTGTIIATDILLQCVNAGKNIDVFNTVLELRKQRTNMVQTEAQYLYIHKLIKDNLDNFETIDLNEPAEPMYENVSVLKSKKESNLITKEREVESQF